MPSFPRLTRGVKQNIVPDTYLYKTLSSDIDELRQDTSTAINNLQTINTDIKRENAHLANFLTYDIKGTDPNTIDGCYYSGTHTFYTGNYGCEKGENINLGEATNRGATIAYYYDADGNMQWGDDQSFTPSYNKIYASTSKDQLNKYNSVNELITNVVNNHKYSANHLENQLLEQSNTDYMINSQIKEEQKIIENDIENVSTKTRLAQLNIYNNLKYISYIYLFKTILVTIICMLFCIGLLQMKAIPSYIGHILVALCLIIGGYFIIAEIVTIYRRDNMNYDNLDWGWNTNYTNDSNTSHDDIFNFGVNKSSLRNDNTDFMSDTGLGCVGSACCEYPTQWNSSKNICMPTTGANANGANANGANANGTNGNGTNVNGTNAKGTNVNGANVNNILKKMNLTRNITD